MIKSPRTVAFSKNATNVFFHILTACNLRCRHCYINPSQHGAESLDIHTIIAWLNVFAQKDNPPDVIFLGGEPTLHPELPFAVKHARELGYQSITIDTNGYLFHDILHRLNPDDVDFISFSLDGATAGVNDSLRGDGAYQVCLNGIRQAVSRGFHTSLIYTVSSANLHELEKMPELLADLGIRRFFIQVVGIRGKPALTAASEPGGIHQVSPEQWLRKVPEVAQKAAMMGISVTYPRVFLRPDEPFACAGRVADNYFIFPNGRVYQCPLCEDYPLHSKIFENNRLISTPGINEADLFKLDIPEGCVMNRIIQPGNIRYLPDGSPAYRIACCLLKEEICGG
ncbi:MAG: radical SAM protein [Deltaproteobacteria bacterium]|nr:radical SAM protein [Deltaproteobacteria bacterium]